MTKLDWFEQAAKVLGEVGARTPFPGQDPEVYKVMEQLLGKFIGECHNGEEVGTDGCPACRAWRTEKAEGVVKGLKEANATLQSAVYDAKAAATLAQSAFDKAREDVVELAEEVGGLQADLKDCEADLEEALAQRDSALSERASAQRQAEAAKAELDNLRGEYDRLQERLRAYDDLANKVKEG